MTATATRTKKRHLQRGTLRAVGIRQSQSCTSTGTAFLLDHDSDHDGEQDVAPAAWHAESCPKEAQAPLHQHWHGLPFLHCEAWQSKSSGQRCRPRVDSRSACYATSPFYTILAGETKQNIVLKYCMGHDHEPAATTVLVKHYCTGYRRPRPPSESRRRPRGGPRGSSGPLP